MSQSEAVSGRSAFLPHRSRRRLVNLIFAGICFLATLVGVVVLLAMLAAVLSTTLKAEPNPPWNALGEQVDQLGNFLTRLVTNFNSSKPEKAGFKAGLAGSLWIIGLVASMAIPIGVGTAVYIEEYARPGPIRNLIQTNLANLAGVPSIVYGILGLALFVRALGVEGLMLGKSLWAGALTLSLLVLPIIVIAAQEALRAVPSSLREAAIALGATRWQVVRDHVVPSALPGIMTGVILALSRAIGETAPLLMVGAAAFILGTPSGPGDNYTVLPVEIYNYAKEPKVAFQSVAAGGILILLILLLVMNSTAILIRQLSSRHR